MRPIPDTVWLAASAILMTGLPATAPSQQTKLPEKFPHSCFDTLPASAMFRVPVYLTVSLIDSSARLVGNDADLMAQSVAERIREILGTHPDTLPVGEPRITWRGVGSSLPVTIHRDRPLTYASNSTTNSAARRLLAQAVEDVRAKGEPFFIWPDSQHIDSLRFALEFTHPTVGRDGQITGSSVSPRLRFLVFSLMVPWEAMAIAEKGNRSPIYPPEARNRGVNATIFLQFVITVAGRADPESIKSVWRSKEPPPSGELGALYARFVESARRATLMMKFKPAQIGGCPINVEVLQPFEFVTAP